MISDVSQNANDTAFDMRGHIIQNGNASHAVCKGLAIDAAVARRGREEKPLRNFLLLGTENVDAMNPLQERHLKTVLSVRIAAMMSGGLNDA